MSKIELILVYEELLDYFGHRNWWPGDTPFEIIVGAILTQNTNWKNVEKALNNLKQEQLLSYKGISEIDTEILAEIIRPSGYYNQKAKKLKAFTSFLKRAYRGSLKRMFEQETQTLRQQLLDVKGIGPETADSILLYAGNHPVFVVDLYTYRLATRHGWIPEDTDYHALQEYFTDRLPVDVSIYNDYHAQIVAVGNTFCRKTPNCDECPLKKYLPE
jgi:endonuclease-3 related protein